MNGKWYALYSKDYTATRVMSLPDCRDLGGEEAMGAASARSSSTYPRYRKVLMTHPDHRVTENWCFESDGHEDTKASSRDFTFTYGPWLSLDIGFVAGCHWGDDSTWKLQVFDLSRAAEGILVRSERFGHVQLGTMPLVNAVRLDHYPGFWELRATIIRQERRDVRSGELIDPYDE